MITTRLFVLALLLIFAFVAVHGWRWMASRRFQRIAGQALPPAVSKLLQSDEPTFLYFTTAECSQCRFRQSPILTQIEQQFGIHVVTIDAAAQPEIAAFYGVMTVPSTVLLDRERRAVAINHGLATAPSLQEQLSAVAA